VLLAAGFAAYELGKVKKDHPEEFARIMGTKPDNPVLVARVVFAAKGNGHIPDVVFTELIAKEIEGKMVVSGTPTPANGFGNFEFRENYVAQDYFNAHASSVKNDDPVPLMHDSMVATINASPLHTGGRISILKVSPNGSEWMEKGECQQVD